MSRNEIDRRFDLHRPPGGAAITCDVIRTAIKTAAVIVAANTPGNREQATAITKLEEALFFAIGSVVRPPSEA